MVFIPLRISIFAQKLLPFLVQQRPALWQLTSLCCVVFGFGAANGDTPLGWINSQNSAAYTASPGDWEFALSAIAVNDTIDFINARDDLIANNQRLVGKSGDLSGFNFNFNVGITPTLSAFANYLQQDLTIDLGEISSADVLFIDDSLDTTRRSAGLKWTFFQGKLLNPDSRISAASLEITAFDNSSDDFDVVIDEIRLNSLNIIFRDPQTFSVNNLEDDGWKAKLIFSNPLGDRAIVSTWLGYGEGSASSGTTSDISSATFSELFQQEFALEETYTYLGASLNIQITPRLPLLLSYEFVDISDSILTQNVSSASDALPGFLRANQSSESKNHSLLARLSYWLTPDAHLSFTGNLFSNQYLGVIPHFNNPLSGSFASVPYGYAGLELGYKF